MDWFKTLLGKLSIRLNFSKNISVKGRQNSIIKNKNGDVNILYPVEIGATAIKMKNCDGIEVGDCVSFGYETFIDAEKSKNVKIKNNNIFK